MSVLPSTSLCGGSAAPVVRTRALHVVPEARTLPTVVGADLKVPTLHGQVAYANLDHAASTPALETRQDGGRPRPGDLLLRPPRRRVRLTPDECLVRAGPRRGRRASSEPAPTTPSIFTRTTTDSWALLSKALPSRTTVFVFGTEHHSTLLPWGRFRTVRLPVPQTVEDAHALLEEALNDHPSRHRLVVLAAASNVTGEVWPIERFASLAHDHGARVAVDAAQLSAHRTIDLAAWDADYVAFSGHKTYAPYGAGVLAGSLRLARRRQPLPARRRRHTLGDRGRHDVGHRPGAPRGRQPQRHRRDRARRGVRDDQPPPRGDRGARDPPARAPARRTRGRGRRRGALDLR